MLYAEVQNSARQTCNVRYLKSMGLQNCMTDQLVDIGRELRRMGDNLDAEVQRSAASRWSLFSAVPSLGAVMSLNRICAIVRRAFRLLHFRRSSIVVIINLF